MTQLLIVVLAIALQVYATGLAHPLRRLMPVWFWRTLMALNLAILARRFLSLVEIGFNWKTETYESLAAGVGMTISICVLVLVLLARKHFAQERELEKLLQTRLQEEEATLREISAATVTLVEAAKLGKPVDWENSMAYRMALIFTKQREAVARLENGKTST